MRIDPRRFGLRAPPFELDPLRALGLYWAATGAWALVDMRTFELVTGPKTDRWLVQSFGALVSATGLGLLVADGPQGRRDAARIGTLGALAIATCEMVFVKRRQIRPIYLADAAVELGLVAAMMIASGPRVTKRPTVTA
ncbi:MAG TPA: hypothetical protein VM305_10280 [Candidatus Limnocylindrales bacterium]|nr:hypothetical protein [Candidatus Limnocylindrales bacterium]